MTDPADTSRTLERRNDHFYDELTRTNNELANLHRAMAVANKELREAQLALQISEQRYLNLSGCSPVGVLELTAAGECRYANAAWRQITGLAESASLGHGWVAAVDHHDARDVVRSWGLGGDGEVGREVQIVTTAGESRWVEVRSRALGGVAGDPGGSVCTIQDITTRKHAEAQLVRVHALLVEASRRAGMAEVAAGVLHKVGTALTSLKVASNCVGEDLRSMKIVSLGRVVALLEAHRGELGDYLSRDPQGMQLGGYLARLSADLSEGQVAALDDLAQLQLHVERINDIVGAHEALVERGGHPEVVVPIEALAHALRTVALPPTVYIVEDYEAVPSISVDKHKLEQILVEILRTAARACQTDEREDPRIDLRITSANERVFVRVAHNGRGIAPAELTRVFVQGAAGGAGVFELHDAAIAATEMGGSLRVQSDGLLSGAVFTLELPAVPLCEHEA